MKSKLYFKSFIVAAVIIGLIFCMCGCSSLTVKSEYDVPISYDDGFVSKIKVPDNTEYVGEMGLLGMEFETSLSEDEVQQFYNDYFSTLQQVYKNGRVDENVKYCYDKEQRMIYSQLNIYKYKDKTRFGLAFDKCEDLNTSEEWSDKITE